MRDLETCREEIFRRSHERIQERKRRQRMALTMCVPLVLCLVIGALAWPGLMNGIGGMSAPPVSDSVQPSDAVKPSKENDMLPVPGEPGIYAPGPTDEPGADGDSRNEYTCNPGESPRESYGQAHDHTPEETVEIEGTDEVLALLSRHEYMASRIGEETVEARDDGEPVYCIVVNLPQGGQMTYYLDGNVLSAEDDSWQLVLDEKEEETLRQTLGLPEASRGRS